MGWRGFGFVRRSRTLFCRAVPNPNLTIRHFFVAGWTAARGDPGPPGRVGSVGADEPATVVTLVPIAAPPLPYVLLR